MLQRRACKSSMTPDDGHRLISVRGDSNRLPSSANAARQTVPRLSTATG
jgi:hypothetical protein